MPARQKSVNPGNASLCDPVSCGTSDGNAPVNPGRGPEYPVDAIHPRGKGLENVQSKWRGHDKG